MFDNEKIKVEVLTLIKLAKDFEIIMNFKEPEIYRLEKWYEELLSLILSNIELEEWIKMEEEGLI